MNSVGGGTGKEAACLPLLRIIKLLQLLCESIYQRGCHVSVIKAMPIPDHHSLHFILAPHWVVTGCTIY